MSNAPTMEPWVGMICVQSTIFKSIYQLMLPKVRCGRFQYIRSNLCSHYACDQCVMMLPLVT
jgi:hypothetical protein